MNSLEKREKLLLIILALLITGYVYTSFFLNPIMKKISEKNVSINEKSSAMLDIEKLKIENKINKAKLEKIKLQYDESLKELPNGERNPEISYELKKTADANNISISTIAFGKEVQYLQAGLKTAGENKAVSKKNNSDNLLMVLPVTLQVNGDYKALINFISDVEKGKRIAEIQDIKLTKNTDKSNSVTGDISLKYYYVNSENSKQIYEFKDSSAGKNNLFN